MLEHLEATLEDLVGALHGLQLTSVATLGLEVHPIPMDKYSNSREGCHMEQELLLTQVLIAFKDEKFENV